MRNPEAIPFALDLADFIEASPTSYHAVQQVAAILNEHGFEELDEKQPWSELASAGYVIRDGAILAWRAPSGKPSDTCGARIIGAHTDSPSFKLKPNPSMASLSWLLAGVEVYGGPLLNSWFDRELGLAGRLTTLSGETKLIRTPPMLRISQLAPHLDRSQNTELKIDQQLHLQPVYSANYEDFELLEYLCSLAEIKIKDLAFYDIYTFPTEIPAIFGAKQEFFASKRLDNLSSVYPATRAFVEAEAVEDLQVLCFFDHEEVGSGSRSGASGPFLSDVLIRLAEGLGFIGGDYQAFLARSFCISADAGHAVNPNYVSYYDPMNRPMINKGPQIKTNARQRYSSDAVSAQRFMAACVKAEVPFQMFTSNNSVSCGSTIGPITAAKMGVTTVDVGISLISMHSARELCGVDDPLFLAQALESYLVN